VQIVTGCNFIYFSALEFFSGTGELTVLAGTRWSGPIEFA
jgi:hypothetical protein